MLNIPRDKYLLLAKAEFTRVQLEATVFLLPRRESVCYAVIPDAQGSRATSRSKEAREPETRCHACRTSRTFGCRSRVRRWRWTIGISIREYRGSYIIDVISGKRATCTCACPCNGGIESREKRDVETPRRVCICISTLIFRFLDRMTTTAMPSLLPVAVCSLRICDYS